VRNQLGTLVDQEHAAAQQVARFTPALGIDVSLGQGAAAQERGNLLGIDAVVLALAAVDGRCKAATTELFRSAARMASGRRIIVWDVPASSSSRRLTWLD